MTAALVPPSSMPKLDTLLGRLDGVGGAGDQYVARCPAHPDRHPSLSIRRTSDRVLIYCWRGCEASDILRALGLDWNALFAEPRPSRPVRTPETERERAMRCVLDADRRAAVKRQEFLPLWLASDQIRHCAAAAAEARAMATALGPDDPRTWPLLARAARVECDGFIAEAALDEVIGAGRFT